MFQLEAGDARVTIDSEAGGRLASLRIGDLELLVPRGADPLAWGCYVMAPWTCRLRDGRFRFTGNEFRLPVDPEREAGTHPIHGTTWDRTWRDEGGGRFSTPLGDGWPFGGHALQQIELAPDHLRLSLEVHATDLPFPAAIGWHPWFRRRLSRGSAARLEFEASKSFEMDEQLMPTGALRAVPPPPWNDCFVGVTQPVRLVWADALCLELRADVDHWVVYDQPADALCVEPMTGPPNALNLEPRIVEPGRPLCAEFEWRWAH